MSKLRKKAADQAPVSSGGAVAVAPSVTSDQVRGNQAAIEDADIRQLCINSDGGTGGILDPGNHAWLDLRDGAGEKRMGLGTWPDSHPAIQAEGRDKGVNDVQTNFAGDLRQAPDEYCADVTPEQITKLLEIAKEPGQWNEYNNCAWWASNTFERVTGEGIDAHDERLLGIPSPRELGENIRWEVNNAAD
jgi:hypothetical protein